jgi:hypothetical protein
MSPGFILDLLLTEAQTNGYLPGLTWDFDSDTDSNGTFWPKEIDVAFEVGTTSILNVVQHFVDEHLLDVEMAATGLVLHAYVSKGEDLSGSVSALYGQNLGRLAFSVKPPGRTLRSRAPPKVGGSNGSAPSLSRSGASAVSASRSAQRRRRSQRTVRPTRTSTTTAARSRRSPTCSSRR